MTGNAMPELVLYTTVGCHLCEQALRRVAEAGGCCVTVEIADDETLLARYGVRIPVLRRPDCGVELDWPFEVAAVRRLRALPSGSG
ncbi:MAG TPA: glutaredoxin family protein [Candidatus Competibacteraceae bacterium]|nr:glutaredoxin family protein [Candidatus Competibacteraceae bacterium]